MNDRASVLDALALQALRDVGGGEFETLVWWVEDEYPRAEAALVAVRHGAGP